MARPASSIGISLTLSMCGLRPRLGCSPADTPDLTAQHTSSRNIPEQSDTIHAQLAADSVSAFPAPVVAMQVPPFPVMASDPSPPHPQASSPAGTTVATGAAEARATLSPEYVTSSAAAVCVGGMNKQASGEAGPRRAVEEAGAKPSQPPIVLMLVGVQGSGKSWFAGALRDKSTSSWVRVNQVCPALVSTFLGSRCIEKVIIVPARPGGLVNHSTSRQHKMGSPANITQIYSRRVLR